MSGKHLLSALETRPDGKTTRDNPWINIELLRSLPNDQRTLDYQQRVALPAVDKLRARLQEALEDDGVGEMATAILRKHLRGVTYVIDQFKARHGGQTETFEKACDGYAINIDEATE